jgi:hypothetical protein
MHSNPDALHFRLFTIKGHHNAGMTIMNSNPFVINTLKKSKMMTTLSSRDLSSLFLMTTSLMTTLSSPAHEK